MYGHFREPSEFTKQAEEFCKKWGIKVQIHYRGKTTKKDWEEDFLRDTYTCKIFRDGKESPSFSFYNSWKCTLEKERPSSYDILCSLEKYNPYSFEDFCSAYGYNQWDEEGYGRNEKAYKIYEACAKMYEWVSDIFEEGSECYKELCEIY